MSPSYSTFIWRVWTHTHTRVCPTVIAQPWICPCWTLVCPQALVIAGISLQTANLYGYIHCKLGGQKPISRVTSRLFGPTDVPKSEYWASAHGVAQAILPLGAGAGSSQLSLPAVSPDSPPSLSGSVTWKSHKPRSCCSIPGSLLSSTTELLPSSRTMSLSEILMPLLKHRWRAIFNPQASSWLLPAFVKEPCVPGYAYSHALFPQQDRAGAFQKMALKNMGR